MCLFSWQTKTTEANQQLTAKAEAKSGGGGGGGRGNGNNRSAPNRGVDSTIVQLQFEESDEEDEDDGKINFKYLI